LLIIALYRNAFRWFGIEGIVWQCNFDRFDIFVPLSCLFLAFCQKKEAGHYFSFNFNCLFFGKAASTIMDMNQVKQNPTVWCIIIMLISTKRNIDLCDTNLDSWTKGYLWENPKAQQKYSSILKLFSNTIGTSMP